MTKLKKLNKNQEKFLIALMESTSIMEASKQAGVSNVTGHNYLNDPTFKAEYARIRRETFQLATNKLQQSAVQAVEVLNNIMVDDENPASSRVQASRAVLENAYKAYEMDDLQQRIEQLEELLNERT